VRIEFTRFQNPVFGFLSMRYSQAEIDSPTHSDLASWMGGNVWLDSMPNRAQLSSNWRIARRCSTYRYWSSAM
jgi:hypothetical protein